MADLKRNILGLRKATFGVINMGRWLKKLIEVQDIHPTKLTEPSFVGFVSGNSEHFRKNNNDVGTKKTELRNLITQLITAYGGTESDWDEYATDVISNWSHDLDSAIDCFNLLEDENRSVLNRKKQGEILV